MYFALFSEVLQNIYRTKISLPILNIKLYEKKITYFYTIYFID